MCRGMVEVLPLWQESGSAHLLWERTRQFFNRGVASSLFLVRARAVLSSVWPIDAEDPRPDEFFDGAATPFTHAKRRA